MTFYALSLVIVHEKFEIRIVFNCNTVAEHIAYSLYKYNFNWPLCESFMKPSVIAWLMLIYTYVFIATGIITPYCEAIKVIVIKPARSATETSSLFYY